MLDGKHYRCDCCGAEIINIAIETRQWDWFKCYLERTYHYCPSCKDGAEARAMFRKSLIEPSKRD